MAGPDHRDGEVTIDDTTRDDTTAGPTTTARQVPRKSAPINKLGRRKTAAPRRPEPAAAKPDSPDLETSAVTGTSAVSETSTEAAPERSGAALTYRERRRAGGSVDLGKRVVTTKTDRSRVGLALAGAVAGLVVIALVVVSVLFATGTDKIDNRAADRAQYSAFARQMIVNLTSLSPSTVDQITDTFQNKTSGKALEQLQQSMQQTTDNIKSAGVTTKGTILSDAVVNSDADSATVILVSGWTMNTPTQPAAAGSSTPQPADQGPVVQTFRWKVVVSKINGVMKLTDIQWVT